ncbi:MAG: hypothetical protein HYW88_00255 [Candidatus Sungbacteria bacterium]|nr:hypothetical protein [Candidatus Sungbacteria bacterium]
MPHSPEHKLGRPHITEEGQDIELGQPRIVETTEEIDQQFKKYERVLEKALVDFLNYFNKGKTAEKSGVERLIAIIREDMTGEDKDITIPLALIEAVQFSLEHIENRVEDKKDAGDIPVETDVAARETARAYMRDFGEIEDFLFSRSDFSDDLPNRSDLLEWLNGEKKFIENNAKEIKDEKQRQQYESLLKSDVPSFDRYLKGLAGEFDCRVVIEHVAGTIALQRDALKDLFHEYIETNQDELKPEMESKLRVIYIMRSFRAILLGEQNEKRVLKK